MQVTIYSRSGCHLCDEAVSCLEPLQKELNFHLQIQLIDGDPLLEQEFGQMVPVIYVNGHYHDHFRVDLDAFKADLEKHRQHR